MNCSSICYRPMQSMAVKGSQMSSKMAVNSVINKKLASGTDTHAVLAAQQKQMNSAVAGGESGQSFVQTKIPEKNKRTGTQGSVQSSLPNAPISSLGTDNNDLSGSAGNTSNTVNSTLAAMRKEQSAVQGGERATSKASPAAMRKEQTTIKGVERATGMASHATMKKGQATVHGGERDTANTSSAAVSKEQATAQGGERATGKASPATMKMEQSVHLSSGKAAGNPDMKDNAPPKPVRSTKVKSITDRPMQGSVLEPHQGVWVSPKTERKHLLEHSVNKETAAAKQSPPAPPSAKLKPRPTPFTLQGSSQAEPKGQGVEAFIVAPDLESPPESPKAKPDNVIARQLSEQADEEGIFYNQQESLGAKSPQDAYTAELLANPKLRQLHDMFPGEKVEHLQKLLEENKGELEKAVAVLIGESTNSSQQQTSGIPADEDPYYIDPYMGKYPIDAPVSTTIVDGCNRPQSYWIAVSAQLL